MKVLKFLFLVVAAGSTIFFTNCGPEGPEPTEEQQKTELLVNNSPWTLSSVELPDVNATEESQWNNFTVSFTNTNMTTASHPAGATAVWPSGGWTFTNGTSGILRSSDNITMTVNSLTETTFSVTFIIPSGTEIGGRVAALDGEYTFVME